MSIVATALLAFAALIAAGNLSVVFQVARSGNGSSMMCLVGGMASLLGCALHPSIDWRSGLLAPFLDPGRFVDGVSAGIVFDAHPAVIAP